MGGWLTAVRGACTIVRMTHNNTEPQPTEQLPVSADESRKWAATTAKLWATINREAPKTRRFPAYGTTVVYLAATVKHEVPDCFDLDLIDRVYQSLVNDALVGGDKHMVWQRDRLWKVSTTREGYVDGEIKYADALLDLFTLMMRNFQVFVAGSPHDSDALPRWADAASFANLYTAGDDK